MPQKDINQEHIKNTSGSPRYGVDSTQMQSNEDSMLWQTAGNIVYEGNGATSQNFATEFADRGIQGFYSSQGSGKRKHLGVQVISDKNPYAPVINGFIHNGAELSGFHVRRKSADKWEWLTTTGTWQETSAGLRKALVRVNQEISDLFAPNRSDLVLEAQWTTPDGNSANCGSQVFSNKLMAHALGGYNGHAYNNTKAAFKNAVLEHHTYFEVDLSYTSDEQLIVSAPRIKGNGPRAGDIVADLTYEEAMDLTVFGEPIMNARELYDLIKSHPNYMFEIDFHKVSGEEARKRVQSLLDDFNHDDDVLSRLLIQVYSTEMHKDIDAVYHFPHYQYLVGMRMDLLDEAIEYSLDHGICALALRWSLATPSVIEKVKAAGLYILTYTVSKDAPLADALLRSGVDTVCTDYITPGALKHASGAVGLNSFLVYYHSGATEAHESYSTAVAKGKLQGSLHTVKSGALEFRDNRQWANTGDERLYPHQYSLDGQDFIGWWMRINIDGNHQWYCADGTFRTKNVTRTTPPTERYMFHDKEKLPPINTVKGAKIVMVAVWTPAGQDKRGPLGWVKRIGLPKRNRP